METPYINIHQDLIDACVRGERAAQFRIYKLYYKAMYNTCLRIVNDTAEAEDIMQESFLDAFRRIGTYTGTGSFGSWLKRIVVNNSLDSLRKITEQLSIEEHEMDFQEVVEESRESELQLQVVTIREAMQDLSDEYRVILSLILFEGYDHEEVSQILGITNNLSRTRFVRAKQKLLEILKENKYKKAFSYN